jgi:hypothetical protein
LKVAETNQFNWSQNKKKLKKNYDQKR